MLFNEALSLQAIFAASIRQERHIANVSNMLHTPKGEAAIVQATTVKTINYKGLQTLAASLSGKIQAADLRDAHKPLPPKAFLPCLLGYQDAKRMRDIPLTDGEIMAREFINNSSKIGDIPSRRQGKGWSRSNRFAKYQHTPTLTVCKAGQAAGISGIIQNKPTIARDGFSIRESLNPGDDCAGDAADKWLAANA